MTWLFAVLVVLALGGVAALAAGYGGPLADEHPDRPDVVAPTDRPLTAADLREVRFPLALRGYRMADVDRLLDRLAREQEADAAYRRPDDPGASREGTSARPRGEPPSE